MPGISTHLAQLGAHAIHITTELRTVNPGDKPGKEAEGTAEVARHQPKDAGNWLRYILQEQGRLCERLADKLCYLDAVILGTCKAVTLAWCSTTLELEGALLETPTSAPGPMFVPMPVSQGNESALIVCQK